MLLVIFMHLSLALFERPSSYFSPSVEIACVFAELLILGVYCIDIALRQYSHDNYTPRDSYWVLCRWAFIGLIFVELLITVVVNLSGGTMFRLTRALRPFFVVEKGRAMRKIFKAIMESLPKIFDVCLLIFLHVLFFGFAGYVLFSSRSLAIGVDNHYFETLETSCLSLFILLTTANYPDVMMPSYNASNWTALFFITFLLFGLYFFMSLILAVVYNYFHNSSQERAELIMKNQTLALCACFDILADPGETLKQRSISVQTWMRFIPYVRKGIKESHALLLFNMLDANRTDRIDLDEFCEKLCEYIDIEIDGDRDPNWVPSTAKGWRRTYYVYKAKMYQLILRPSVSRFFDAMVAINALIIFVQVLMSNSKHELQSNRLFGVRFDDWNRFFLSIFVIEAMMKSYALGAVNYWRDNIFNKLDVIVIISGVAGELFTDVSGLAIFTLFRMIRMVRILRTLKRFKPIFVTLAQVVPALAGLFGVLFCVYYSFAIVGMETLSGKITYEKQAELTDLFTRERLVYAADNYWENNFNDLTHSLVTLWELMIVNNWYITMNAYAAATTRYARLYFVAFYFVSVVVVMNVVVAFILEAFMAQFTRVQTGEDEAYAHKVLDSARKVLKLVNVLHDDSGGAHRKLSRVHRNAARRKSTVSGLYELFGDHSAREMHSLNSEQIMEHKPTDVERKLSMLLSKEDIHLDRWHITRKVRTSQLYMAMFEKDLEKPTDRYAMLHKWMENEQHTITEMQDLRQDRQRRQTWVARNMDMLGTSEPEIVDDSGAEDDDYDDTGGDHHGGYRGPVVADDDFDLAAASSAANPIATTTADSESKNSEDA
eukprot:TRINITY_DN66376_c5_g1_i2.p1 TRINITY_DN66376_c5_g1~~TRINITY_DN66376_c5_g1_i2.p1  ORF type:complete len:829 (-),score=434.81 TRINITY_DN66376_c5_g1_i2:379-2865(-)